ncbi:MAG: hypothetical protein LAT67_07280 [Balneolales bacterium]|nr:hypothetical protein [Balneolales bacterium]
MKLENTSLLGKYTTHTIGKRVPKGYHLITPDGEAFLSDYQLDEELREGDEIEAVTYHDYDGFLTASTQKPKIETGKFELLRIKAAGDKGAFADWGLEKDLFIPHAEQLQPVVKGESYLIYAYLDEQSGRLAGSTRVDRFAKDTISHLDESERPELNQQVELLISRPTELGYRAIIEGEKPLSGVLYKNELTKIIRPGQRLTGYIKQLRDDDKIDLTLRKPGYSEVETASDDILFKLGTSESGFLPFHDKSSPTEIRSVFGISKRTFKAAIGGLYKAGQIQIENNGIYLKEQLEKDT